MDLSNLNSEQQKAVKHIDGPLLILAGAGSGKTTTMTHRIAYMIEQGVSPYQILAVTFTNKAAGEMRERVERLVPHSNGMWIMTFHAMCLRMLRTQCELLGYKPGFTLYDETDRKSLVKRIMKQLEVNEKMYPVSYVISVISGCKEQEQNAEKYLYENGADFRAQTVYNIYKTYEQEMMRNNAMDFDDLILNGVRLLEVSEELLSYYRNRFRYIMVDEYQDTNYLQYKLIHLLSETNRNLCAVGDDDQCIYQWRGADIRNILDFEKDFPEVTTIKLEQNYRSYGNILDLANSVICNNKGRKSKALWTEKDAGEKIIYRRLGDEKKEAWYIGSEIDRLHDEGYAYGDMAILYRKNAQSRAFEEKFSFRGIPYRVLAGLRFYDRKEIKDMMAYMHLVENPDDDVSMLRIINEPKRGVGPKTLTNIQAYAASYRMSIYRALCEAEVIASLPKKAGAALKELVQMLEDLRGEVDNLTLPDLYDNILNRSGYLNALEQLDTVEADGRIENVMEFKSVIAEFENSLKDGDEKQFQEDMEAERQMMQEAGFEVNEPTPLASFLERITLMADIDNRDEKEDAVVLMTLHSAKGLEFPIVFIPGMENGVFPGLSSFDEESRLEEERRLCYVGITRAKEKLYLTSATTRMLYGRTDYTTESMFLDEMDKQYLDGETAKQKAESQGGLSGDGGLYGDYFYRGRAHGTEDGFFGVPEQKPFDSLKYARKQAEKKYSNDDLEVGDQVRHPKFGVGMLLEDDGKIMKIAFDSVGIKKIGKGFVNIEKVK
jgi:DNA helicase II / ATP-dependent DNA helicase PcrA